MNRILLILCGLCLVACHKEKPIEKNLDYHLDRQFEATLHGREILSKHFAGYKQKLIERKITEIVCLPTKNIVSEPWHFECKITTTDNKSIIIKENTPFHLFGRAWITTEPFVIDCGEILNVSGDSMNRETFKHEFDRLLVLFDKGSKK